MRKDALEMFSLRGKKGLILGLANEQSIAWGCTRLFHELGAEMLVSCLNDKARKWVAPLTDGLDAQRLELMNCNVEHSEELQALVARAVARMGRLDFVIHSIAWAPLQDLHGPVSASSREGFSRAMQITCHSFAELAQLCQPHMSAGGSMLAMSYQGASQAVPNYALMGPVKAALESLVRYLAVELGPQQIRVHAVSPGPIPTRAASGLREFDRLLQQSQQRAPLQRLVTLDEIAQLCAFLCMDAASGLSGQTLYVDAGEHAVA